MKTENIIWEPLKSRHLKGTTSLGPVWIRINREGKVTGMYTIFGKTVKYTPDEEWLEEIEAAQLRLDEIYEKEVSIQKWGEKLRNRKNQ